MDTRGKIADSSVLDSLVNVESATFVSGYFDPLWAPHAERLEELSRRGRPLVVLLADPPDPLLPSRSRAELLAGLDCVDHVLLPEPSGKALDPKRPVVQEERSDLDRRRQLILHVHSRHGSQ
ncbi:MAG: hypothetical protein U0Q16_10670 [Bryobacteraceae bacterium]